MSVKLCEKLTCCSKPVIFSTKLNQFVPIFLQGVAMTQSNLTTAYHNCNCNNHDVRDFETKSN